MQKGVDNKEQRQYNSVLVRKSKQKVKFFGKIVVKKIQKELDKDAKDCII